MLTPIRIDGLFCSPYLLLLSPDWSDDTAACPTQTARCAQAEVPVGCVGPELTEEDGAVPRTQPHDGAYLIFAFVSSTNPRIPFFGIKGQGEVCLLPQQWEQKVLEVGHVLF